MIIISYTVDKDLYYSPGTSHNIVTVTTEYVYKNEMLVRLEINKNLGIRLNNLIQYQFKKDDTLEKEHFFYKKTYHDGKAKKTTRSTFEDKMKRFDMAKTIKEQELLEEYAYTDKNGRRDEVQIVIMVKGDTMTAVIDFKDAEQNINFIPPPWLTERTYK